MENLVFYAFDAQREHPGDTGSLGKIEANSLEQAAALAHQQFPNVPQLRIVQAAPAIKDTQLALAIRAGEVVQHAIRAELLQHVPTLRMGGHHQSANSYEGSANLVRRVDVAALLGDAFGQLHHKDEEDAFQFIAGLNDYNTRRDIDGQYAVYATRRVRAVFDAGVRFERLAKSTETGDPKPDALYPDYKVPQRRVTDHLPGNPLNWDNNEGHQG